MLTDSELISDNAAAMMYVRLSNSFESMLERALGEMSTAPPLEIPMPKESWGLPEPQPIPCILSPTRAYCLPPR